jgi:uncharacterized membrane protein
MTTPDPYDVITATFAHDDGAEKALAVLERAEKADLLDIENAAVVVKDASGTVEFAETQDQTGWQGLGTGMLLGGILGLLLPGRTFGPSVLKTGVQSAFGARLRDGGFEDDDLRAMADSMEPGTSMLVAIVQYQFTAESLELLREQGADVASARLSGEGAALLTSAGASGDSTTAS